MNIQTLISLIPYYRTIPSILDEKIIIKKVEVDSRNISVGDAFICIPGYTVDGHDFAATAARQGAAIIIAEKELDVSVPVIIVPDTTRALALIAAAFYEHPTKKLDLIGITGTNGKTTTTYILEALFQAHDKKTGVIGTIQMKIGDEAYPIANTTPHALELQQTFARMNEEQVDVCMMEVSSHALDLGRVFGSDFSVAIYTNLSQDHLDYHQTMDAYFHAKSLLFSQLGSSYDPAKRKYAIINADDAYSTRLQKVTAQPIVTYGLQNKADVYATDVKYAHAETTFVLNTPVGDVAIRTPLIGSFNVYNMLAAASAALVQGVALETIATTFEHIQGVDGRFEQVQEGQDFTVIVDYAHTPDSLQNVLETAKEFAKNNVYVVVGCGGDRDTTKRPLMAQIAVKDAHHAIFTSDNPRTEDPESIIKDMTDGIEHTNYESIVDRKKAIQYAVEKAEQDDIIIIAGKGHETEQIIGTEKYVFDDRQVAAEAIRSLAKEKE